MLCTGHLFGKTAYQWFCEDLQWVTHIVSLGPQHSPPDAQNAACCWLAAESLLRHCHWPNKMLHLRLHPLLEGSLYPGTRQYPQYTSPVPWTSQKGQPTRPPHANLQLRAPFNLFNQSDRHNP